MKNSFTNDLEIFDPFSFLKDNFDYDSTEIPNEMPKFSSSPFSFSSFETDPFCFSKEFALREAYIETGMFGFVSWKWVNPFVEWLNGRKCLELMAGRGWLSYALSLKDINIIATDNFSWHKYHTKWNDTLVDIEKIDALKAVEKYGSQVDVVIISWPYKGNETFNSLKKLNLLNPDALFVFIGEPNPYVCADEEFLNNFELINDDQFKVVQRNFQSWEGFKDQIYLGKYKNNL